jgi:hypothetical protein
LHFDVSGGDDYDGLGQQDDDFEDSMAGGSGAGPSGETAGKRHSWNQQNGFTTKLSCDEK